MEHDIDFYKHFGWLKKVNASSSANGESYQQRLSRLEGDKESLILQEFLHRTSLESQKLSLMGEVSYLKLKLSDMEGKQGYGAERQHKAESVVNFISELQEQMCRFQKEINSKIREKKALQTLADGSLDHELPTEAGEGQASHAGTSCDGTREPVHGREEGPVEKGWREDSSEAEQQDDSNIIKELRTLKEKVEHLEDQKLQYEKKLKATKAEIGSLQQLVLTKNAEIESLQTQLLTRPSPSTEDSEKDRELQRMRITMKSLVAANDEKDRRIEELTLLLKQCRQFREVTHPRPAPPAVGTVSNGRTPSTSSEEELQEPMKRSDSAGAKSEDLKSEVSHASTSSSSSPHTSSSAQKDGDFRIETPTSPHLSNGTSQKSCPSDSKHQTLPRNSSPSEQNGSSSSESRSQRSPEGSEDGDSSQKADEARSSSSSPLHCEPNVHSGPRSVGSPEYMKTNSSFRRLWGKLRRTQSGGFQSADPEAAPFKRGGLRATAGPRLTRTPEASASSRDMSVPFSQWTKEQVCGWLEDFGLGQYVNLTRQWVESGQTLLSATPQDLEKEMRMRNPLHRKKLQLALRAFSTKTVEKSSELDYIWVARWLDDIGLPQYKDQFHEARVDGRMIQYLTVNDLLSLKVTSQLHHLSIKCAIHVLHANKFNPNCLRRRPGEERNPSPSEVVQWSNHRVMEWLRSVDLAEFAPNLRGSGVHGGLIILEPRFSSETLALLLNIPPQKTLLRRHLATAFSALVGAQAAQEKREYANATGHIPLTTTAKVKPKKLGFTQFSHLRKRKQDDSLDYICPMDTGAVAVNGGSPPPSAALKGLSPPRQADQQEDEVETGAQTGSKH
ncbi:liprin-beta-2 isoform X2 [Takifugu flavidus]|uniref:liprin-beta-2 isoform X2 n=1 Tax=Takifugu flavidus TaxID=433684 RepID=UPI0025443D47|nr:liprin-beta-2 isoform X2 [Takifugu flavidus]